MQWNSFHDTSYGSDLLVGFVQDWYDEVVDVDWAADGSGVQSKMYGDPSQCKSPEGDSGKCMIGHYTQLVWASTSHVGCGVASCDQGLGGDGGVFFVCKYTPPGNMVSITGAMPTPYTAGAPCATCGGSCTDNLCSPGSPTHCEDDIQ